MGLFKNLFKAAPEKDTKVLPWIPLNSIAQLNLITEASKSKPQIIFKHSNRCGISKMVLNRFIDDYELTEKRADLYYLDILNYRDVSNEVSYRFQILHESPQLLIIKDGEVVAHGSHGVITTIPVESYI